MDVAAWLRGLGLEEYEPAFRDNGVDADVLLELTAEDLNDLGIAAVDHRRKLLAAIAALGWAPPAADRRPVAAASVSQPERRQLTVLFADLVGSTELSERLDPEDMGALIRAYQNTVAGEVTRVEGHVAKHMGDGVLAYFGYPKAHEDAAERAVDAGLALTERTNGALLTINGSAGGSVVLALIQDSDECS